MKKKISVKTLYLLGIITIGLIGLGVGSTYAMFTVSAEIDNPISINANLNSEDDIIETIDIEIEPNDIRVAVINLNNISNTTLNYASFYITESSDIEVGVTHNFTDTAVPTGSISNGTTKKVYIQIKNSGSSTANVTLGVLSNSGTIIKANNMTLINDTNIDTTSPELLITGQDMAVQNGLIRYYNGSNNLEYSHSSSTTIWKDLSGNYDGEVKSSTWSTDSITLNGTNSHVRIGQINNLTAVTVEVYLKSISYTADSANQIISNYNGNGLVLQLNKGVPGFSIGSGKAITSDETMGSDLNHTITGTYDGSTVKLYVDGVLKKTLSSTAGISNPSDSTPMVIGCNPNETGCDTHYTNANIYAVRVYNRALTESEIKQNMNADRVSTGEASQSANGTYTLISNKRLNNFTTSNITVTNGTKGTFTKVNDRKYNLNITGVSGSTTAEISIPANNLIDVSGNKNSNSIVLSRYMDVTGPTATITKNTSTSRTVTYTISFHEPAYGFTKDDIKLSEGTKSTFTKINQKTYTLVVTHASDGSKTITVNANSCNDRFGNLNAAKSLTHTVSTGTPLATYITNLYNNATKTEVGPTGQKYQYDTTHKLMKDVGGNIRYYGASPNNYIYFNCDTYPSTNCEKWRIIGVTDGKVKLVRNEPIGKYSLDNSVTRGNSNWVNARLMKMLNPVSGTAGTGDGLYWNRKSGTCYSGSTAVNATKTCDMSSIGLKEKTRTLIPDMTWYLRSGDDIDMLPSAAYNLERTTGKVYTGRATTWTGKVALIYSSDYGYAAEISNAIGSLGLRKHCTKMTLPNYSDTYCTSNNWLYPILSSGKSNARIMGHSTKEVYFAWYVTGNGSVGTEIVSWYEYNIVPTLYLNTSVSINTTGNGSSSNPYQIVS